MIFQILTLMRWEFFRQIRKIGVLVLYGLALLLAVLALAFGILQNLEVIPFPITVGYLELASGVLWRFSPLLAIVTVALVHAADLQGGSSRTLAARGISRDAILGAKALFSSLSILGYHLVVLALALVLAVALAPHFEGWRDGLAGIGTSFVNALLYLALAIALAHARQSVAFTVGLGIAIIFLEAIAYPLAGFLGELLNWPIDSLTAWTFWGISQGLQGQSDLLARSWFIPITAAYAAALIGLAVLTFRKQDLRAGSD